LDADVPAPGVRVPAPGVLVETIDLEPEDRRDAWAEWYDRTYLVNRSRLDGVLAARRGTHVTGSVQNIVVYDLTDVTTPHASDWKELDQRLEAGDPAPDEVRDSLLRVESMLYRQILSTVERYEPPDAAVLHGAFFEVDPSDHDEFNDWYDTEHVLFVDVIDGYLNCRRFQSLVDPSRFLALYDVTTLEVAQSERTAKANESPWTDRIRAKIATYRERRLFHVARVVRGESAEGHLKRS
jgi:hypothetical protein